VHRHRFEAGGELGAERDGRIYRRDIAANEARSGPLDGHVPIVAPDELRALIRSGLAAGDLSAARGVPAVIVDGGSLDADGPRIDDDLALPPCVLIGIDGAPGQLVDVQVPDLAAASELAAGVAERPIAAVSLVLLLRGGERRTIEDGLIAESSTYSLLQAGPEFAAWREEWGRRPHRERAATTTPAVRVERRSEVLELVLDRPERHNAFSREMSEDLVVALSLATADPTIERVELRGAGPSFCSGGDLSEFGSFPDPASAHVVRLTRSVGRLLAQLGDRVEVHLHGACMGAGIELPAFTTRVVADRDAVIALPEITLGLVPGAGGTVSLPRRIGRHRTAWLGLTGARIDAATAHDWGLVDEVAPTAR
jgi:enoyl-CoA hydratase/carnithine racemase